MTKPFKINFLYLCTFVLCLLVSQASLANAKDNGKCKFIEITDDFYNTESLSFLDRPKDHAIVLKLNNSGGNYFRSMMLARRVREADIPVIIEKGAKCSNDCSAAFLASPLRYSYENIFFPRYSMSEKKIIESLKPNAFYPTIRQKSVLLFLTEGFSEPLKNVIYTSYRDLSAFLYPAINTPELEWLSASTSNKKKCNEIVSTKLTPTAAPNNKPNQ